MMRLERASTTRRNEDGVFLVLYALMLVAIFAMVAIVLDLSAVRNGRRISRSAADAAATAGALDLGLGPKAACETAMDYAARNLGGFSVPGAPCVRVPTTCGGIVSTQMDVGDYKVFFRNPVPNNDPMMKADTPGGDINQSSTLAIEGEPCKRVGISITYTRPTIFSRVAGITQNETSVHSVALSGDGTSGEPVALLVLDQTGCDVVTTSGQGSIIVEDTVTSLGVEKPGIIALDSDGSASGNPIPGCGNANSHTIEAADNSNNTIEAEGTPSGIRGIIRSFAMSGPNASKAYDPADVSSVPARLSPIPTSTSRRITRAPIDHRYNCKVANGCADPPNPYIDQLVAALGGSGATPPPAGNYRRYPDELVTPPPLSGEVAQPSAACSMPSSAAPVTVPVGNWFVDCNSGLSVSNVLRFLGGNVVTRSGISVGAQGQLTINVAGATSVSNGVLFLRTGDLSKDAQGSLTMPRVTVYMASGRIDIGAGTGRLDWVAPSNGNFDDLALWSELSSTSNATEQRLGGQSSLNLEGVLFTPNAQFRFTGQPGVNQTKAQFITKRLSVAGQGALRMKPDPERVVLLPIAGTRLIR